MMSVVTSEPKYHSRKMKEEARDVDSVGHRDRECVIQSIH